MNQEAEPRWDLLPHDPAEFFQLAEGFDRKDLKRKYNGLLRRFKPERFPDEFQKLRAAYESLDSMLRYGQQVFQNPFRNMNDWGTADAAAAVDDPLAANTPAADAPVRRSPDPPAPPRDRIAVIIDRLANERPAAIYAELASRARKTPFDFYALAVLSDIAVDDDPLMFLKWLLTGLKQHPQDPALLRLLYEQFRMGIDDANLAAILVAVSKTAANDRFYFLTEKLWDRVLAQQPFEKFHQLLSRCEANLRDFRIEGKVAFYVHILRGALGKAPEAWLDQVMEFLNENHDSIPPDMEYEMELSSRLLDYFKQRYQFVNDHPVRVRIDKALIAFCSTDELAANQAVVECQTFLASDAKQVLDAFPYHEETPDALLLWQWVGEEVRQHLGEDEEELDLPDVYGKVYRRFKEIDRDDPNLIWSVYFLSRNIVHIAATALLFFLPFFLFGSLMPSGLGGFLFLAVPGLCCVAAYWFWLRHKLTTKYFERWWMAIATRRYQQHYRPVMIRLLIATHYSYETLMTASFKVVEAKHEELSMSTWVPSFMQNDDGLWVYALARRFLR